MAQSKDRENIRDDQELQEQESTNKGEHGAETGNEDLGEGDMNRRQRLEDENDAGA